MSHTQLRINEIAKNAIKNLFVTYGESDYIGESITQLDHAVQSGLLAMNDKRPTTTILAAFLHDIGHLVGLSVPAATHMINSDSQLHLGIQNHEELGAQFLTSLGFPRSVTNPISNHVLAKRYLLTIDNSYRQEVSAASLQTFVLQGGSLSLEERQAFESSPFFDESILLRYYDDMAKVPNLYDNKTNHEAFNRLINLVDEVIP